MNKTLISGKNNGVIRMRNKLGNKY